MRRGAISTAKEVFFGQQNGDFLPPPPLSQQPVGPFGVGVSVKGENSGERGFGLLTRPSTVHDSITETGLQLAARPTNHFPTALFLSRSIPRTTGVECSRAAAAFAAKSLAVLLNPRKTRGGQISLLSLPIYTAPLVKIFFFLRLPPPIKPCAEGKGIGFSSKSRSAHLPPHSFLPEIVSSN